MTYTSKRLGFRHFVLSYDKRCRHRQTTLFIHNLPAAWTDVCESLVLRDLIGRAGERSVTGFHWRDLENLIPLTRSERQLLATGREIGVDDGYSISRHLPGEASGCCSFVAPVGVPLTRNLLLFADLAGTLAIASARRIAGGSGAPPDPVLSDRQRECVLWWARGKTASEIAVILGIAKFTAAQHLKMARERYNVPCRQMLILCALFDGLIGFSDICDWWPSEKPL
ncbi:LuxR family transcriptional regulator [Sphingopyxis indica]|nr:LuxR family transcriptional regulator [Sphingopyxis indica]